MKGFFKWKPCFLLQQTNTKLMKSMQCLRLWAIRW
jgi:hypothetical protein